MTMMGRMSKFLSLWAAILTTMGSLSSNVHGFNSLPLLVRSSKSKPTSTRKSTAGSSINTSNRAAFTTPTRLYQSSSSSTPASNNVVLRPSDDPKDFDSHQVGTARVHRYSRQDDPDEKTEYVMWYHGRSQDFDSNKELPPLSTGRIGRATSRNGLHWIKDQQGSLSEDAPGVSLGLNKDSWWGFDTSHVGLGSVLLPMSTPAVMTDGGVYIMYYMGGNFEETPIKDYLDNHNIPDSTNIKGMKMKIGIALSQDGISWGRVEGDDPSGACMVPYDTNDPNAQAMIASSSQSHDSHADHSEELYCAWPEVVVNLANGENGKNAANDDQASFLMFYSTMTRDTKQKCIAHAVSQDGFRWFKRGVCLRPDDNDDDAALDSQGCARCNVLQNARYDQVEAKWVRAEGWTMYYEGENKQGKHRIMVAESMNGRFWEKRGVALDVDSCENAWDCQAVGSPNVVRMDDGSQRMYYTGKGKNGSTAIGVAKLPNNGKINEWEREQASFSFA